jgi:hypothetical protein
MKILSVHGNDYKTFGENIILLLNREGKSGFLKCNSIILTLSRRDIFAITYA